MLALSTAMAWGGNRQKFNSGWLLAVGDIRGAGATGYDDHAWERVTLPRAWNEAEAFRVPIHELSDTIMWYRKHFTLHDVANRSYSWNWRASALAQKSLSTAIAWD